jgi:hypothetical protein
MNFVQHFIEYPSFTGMYTQDCNFACVSIWAWNMVSDTEDVWEQGAEENIWTKEGWSDERAKKTT